MGIPKENISSTQLKLDELKLASTIFRAINHPLRLAMVNLIEEFGRLTVTQIYFKLRVEQSVASQHLAILRESEIVTATRDGKHIYYAMNHVRLQAILRCIDTFKA
jgi:DNA-binding transcriptional ArsR family regulator